MKRLLVSALIVGIIAIGTELHMRTADAQATRQPWHTVSYQKIGDGHRAIVEYSNGRMSIVCNEFFQESDSTAHSTSSVSCIED